MGLPVYCIIYTLAILDIISKLKLQCLRASKKILFNQIILNLEYS